jgi:hypothetical protein
MTTADRVHQAATKIRAAAKAVEADAQERHARIYAGPRVLELRRLGFDRTDVALAVADWLDAVAADKTAGLGCIHPRAIDLTNLILGDTA